MTPLFPSFRAVVLGWLLILLPGALGQGIPQLVSVSTLRAEPGASVNFNGFHFLNPPVTAVYFNFTRGTIESIRNIAGGQQQLSVRVPLGATIGPIIIENAFGQYQSQQYFQVPPVITRFERAGATTDADRVRGVAGNLVLLSGANYLDTTDPAFRLGVFFDGVRAVIDTVTESAVSVYVPAGAGTGPITVTNNAGRVSTASPFFIPPAVTGFTPRGRVGDSVAVTGRSFRAVSAVYFGAVSATNFIVVSPTNLSVVVPTGAPASAPLVVESPGGRFLTASNFVLQPRISSFTPVRGDRGTNVTLTGTGLAGVQQVLFGGVSAAPTTVSATQVTVSVPLGAGTGPITVVSATGQDVSSNLFYLAPRITALGGTRLRTGDSLVISGTNLLGTTAVQFGTNRVVASSFTVDNNRQVTAVVPTNAVSGRIWVVAPGGEVQSDSVLTILGANPQISGFSPPNGAVGSVVHVIGTQLFPALAVRIGGVAASVIQAETNGLAVTVPAGAVSGRIVVETVSGTAFTASDFLVGSTVDLSVEMSPSANPVVVGTEFRLTVRVRNAGPLPADGIRATLGIPSPTQFLGATPSFGTFSQAGGEVAFQVGALASGASWNAQIRLKLASAADVLFPFSATNAVSESGLGNNSSSLRIQAVPLRLDFSLFGNQLVLSWPSSVTNAVLQQSEVLSPGQWRDAGLVPFDDEGRLQVTVEAAQPQRFFRLQGR